MDAEWLRYGRRTAWATACRTWQGGYTSNQNKSRECLQDGTGLLFTAGAAMNALVKPDLRCSLTQLCDRFTDHSTSMPSCLLINRLPLHTAA